ncbi:uncharacterized protein TrAFT101_003764 [Trichoderma asperellum]|uniref:Uncharacterized protein n=1 Tax=Trichoderma asperellum (strain ATCC 204424 / CBS 433.97 / NBRC 101777) TaxID=1042311 RepID=A0A2T3ZPU3_TRIA4|nr:hypothetical protein M441DRAFT_22764 [Trichoderma asperellum CBS 433.97]PTB46794.1 hypothetical protein M441DRAFT_22764 [Trichoderma asperellum CBS 433.97]UKZ87996.1 hypothetical protein TrAFT101_003764 [Trichoderma asperellum]
MPLHFGRGDDERRIEQSSGGNWKRKSSEVRCWINCGAAWSAVVVGLATYVGTLALSTPAFWAQPLKRSLLDDFNSGESS